MMLPSTKLEKLPQPMPGDFSTSGHFSATSHGKGACDGLVKRLAARASLRRQYNDTSPAV